MPDVRGEALVNLGHTIIEATHGELASGLVGQGRMAEPEEIIAFVDEHMRKGMPLYGKKVLVNAGPTYEKIDAVRFIGNFSTGKMGVAIAKTAAALGADVTLVLGPTQHDFNLSGLQVVRVTSAQEMLEACKSAFNNADYTVLSAAVADYKPKTQAAEKIKKQESDLNIALEPTVDILATLGKEKKEDQVLVGFALETNDELNYAKEKLNRKNLDFIVLNSLREKGAGFGHDTNKVVVLSKSGKQIETDLLPKTEIAQEIWKIILA